MYNLQNNPKLSSIIKATSNIKRRLSQHPDKKFLIFYVVAGHGVMIDGRVAVLVNEFKKSDTFYKIFGAEADIRKIATEFRNSYSIAWFACCREIFNRDIHSGGISEEKAKQLIAMDRHEKFMQKIGGLILKKFYHEVDRNK